MKYNITQHDKDLLTVQKSSHYKYRLFVVGKDKGILGELDSLENIGTYQVDSGSETRRAASFTMYLDSRYVGSSMESKLADWIGCSFELQIGIYDMREDSYQWYKCGYYLITDANTSYNAADNSITASLSDGYSKLDGTRNGQIGGSPTILIPNEDAEGRPITIKQATEGLLKSEAGITDYIVEDIGQFYGMPQNNPDYAKYRLDNPLWNQLPYDLEYEAGCTVSDILSEINGLYPNCEMYFDIYGNFCSSLIPSCEHDPISLDNSFIQKILMADSTESVGYDIPSIRNVTEVFGSVFNVDRYAISCTSSGGTYIATLENYGGYRNGDTIAFIPDATNKENTKICINSLEPLPLCYEYTTSCIERGLLESGKTYVFQVRKQDDGYIAYFMGQYQPHAICVLTDNADDTLYTKQYFAQKYNCDERNVTLRVEPGSPFTVQKLGEILDVKSGDEFENITSDSVATENAVYYNRKSSSMNDTATITTKLIPFLDVNIKIEYRKQQEDETHCYIVKSVSNDTGAFTSTITMYRFYPLYYA